MVKTFLVVFSLFFLAACQLLGTIYNVGSKVGAVVMDERSLEDDWTDTKINTVLRSNLMAQKAAYGIDIEITVFEGQIMLNGALPTIEDIERVAEIAWQMEAATNVYNYIRLEDPGSIIDASKDAYIASNARNGLMFTQGITSVNYKITVDDSTLYVMGIARGNREYEQVMNILKSQKGINRIVSHVRKSDTPEE